MYRCKKEHFDMNSIDFSYVDDGLYFIVDKEGFEKIKQYFKLNADINLYCQKISKEMANNIQSQNVMKAKISSEYCSLSHTIENGKVFVTAEYKNTNKKTTTFYVNKKQVHVDIKDDIARLSFDFVQGNKYGIMSIDGLNVIRIL
jgi:hypothetical protein